MRNSFRYLGSTVLLLTIGLFGCNPNSSSDAPVNSVALPPEQSVEDLPLVNRAEFVHWSRFPLGTTVERIREIANDHGKVTETTRYKLLSKSTSKVVVESQVTVDRENRILENPPLEFEYPATFRLPKGMNAENFALPDFKAVEAGTESVEVLEHQYQAAIYTWKAASEAGPQDNKMWMCDEVPGRVVRHETSCAGVTSVERISKIQIPSEKSGENS